MKMITVFRPLSFALMPDSIRHPGQFGAPEGPGSRISLRDSGMTKQLMAKDYFHASRVADSGHEGLTRK